MNNRVLIAIAFCLGYLLFAVIVVGRVLVVLGCRGTEFLPAPWCSSIWFDSWKRYAVCCVKIVLVVCSWKIWYVCGVVWHGVDDVLM